MMKQTLALLFVSALLVFSLAACGTDDTVSDDYTSGSSMAGSGSDGYVQDPVTGAPVPNDSANSASHRNTVTGTVANDVDKMARTGANAVDRVANDAANGVDRMVNDAAGVTRHATDENDRLLQPASYNQMVRNGMVHDTDGFLKDGENAMTPGIKH